MHDCVVCGKTDAEKPMCNRGEKWCSEKHRKILAGEYGYDLGRLFEMGLITQEEAARLWGTDFETGEQVKVAMVTAKGRD